MRRRILSVLVVFSCWLPVCETATANDWPMYRCDTRRRGVTEDSLSENLPRAWMRELPKLTPTLKDKRLLIFSEARPIEVGRTCV